MKTNILVFGATSAIAEATCRQFAENGSSFFLVARNTERLRTLTKDLKARGAVNVFSEVVDISITDQHLRIIEEAAKKLTVIDVAFLAHGTLPIQKICESDISSAISEYQLNCISYISLLSHLANYFELRKCGSIVAITSVAGDRGRQSNYIYGSAKGAVTLFLQGIRHRLFNARVHVMTVKPGLIITPMTSGLKKGMLWSKPETVATDIIAGLKSKKDEIYSPRYWRIVLLLIRFMPNSIFHRTKL